MKNGMSDLRGQIVDELNNVRYYYSHLKEFENNNLLSGFLPIVSKYDNLINSCSDIKLVDIYFKLYHCDNNLTSLSIILSVSLGTVKVLYNKLLDFFVSNLSVSI